MWVPSRVVAQAVLCGTVDEAIFLDAFTGPEMGVLIPVLLVCWIAAVREISAPGKEFPDTPDVVSWSRVSSG